MRNHKKLIALCNALQINRAEAIGHLHMLWWWAIENRENGDLNGLFDRDIAMACDWDKDPKLLIDALHSTLWLENYHISDWDDYSWRLLSMRKSNRDRQKKHRNAIVTRDVTRYVPPATEPNLTKQNKRYNNIPQSLEECIKHFTENLKSDAEHANDFFSFYASKGWLVGKSPMKNWRMAAARSLKWSKPQEAKVVREPRPFPKGV